MSIQIASLPSPVMFGLDSSPRLPMQMLTSPMSSHASADADGPPGHLDIQRALDIARNTEGDLDHSVSRYLEERLAEVWNRIESHPSTYVLTKDEFAIFNYFIGRYQGSELAEKAIARFWSNYQEEDNQIRI